MVFNGNTESKTEHTIWKSIKNWAENWCQIVCGILFDLIYSMTSSVNAWKVPELRAIFLTRPISRFIHRASMPAPVDPRIRQLKIKTGVCKRSGKEKLSYLKVETL